MKIWMLQCTHGVCSGVTWWCFKTAGAPLFWWLPATRWVTLSPKEPPGSRWGHVPSPAEQQSAFKDSSVWRDVQGPGPLSANWDNLEDHSSSRTSLRPRCWPGPVTCSSACSCFLHSPLSLIPRPPPNNLMPANLHLITSFPGNLACLCN